MTIYSREVYVKLNGKYKVQCNGEDVENWGQFSDGSSEADGEGWVDYINLDENGLWECDEESAIIRRRYGLITWEPLA